MKDRINRWLERLDNQSERVKALFGNLNDAELEKKISPKEWSIAQNLKHLMVVNNSYFPTIESVRSGKPKLNFLSKFSFMRGVFGKLILDSVQPDRKRKMQTFPVWEPKELTIENNVVEEFLKHQEKIKQLIADSEDLLLSSAFLPSPANRNIAYSLEDAFEIIVTHGERHINQAAEILKK